MFTPIPYFYKLFAETDDVNTFAATRIRGVTRNVTYRVVTGRKWYFELISNVSVIAALELLFSFIFGKTKIK